VLNKAPSDGESKCFFAKMKGDYYRYMAENATGANLETVKNHALAAYKDAMLIDLPACNPIKLGLALNFSVFYQESMKQPADAMALADQALADALDKIDELDEDNFHEAKSIIELLKENLTLWKGDAANDIDDL
jgi:14-3-3 protein epsilon